MVVRFFDKENMPRRDNNYDTTARKSCNSNTCNQQLSSVATVTTTATTTSATKKTESINNLNDGDNHLNFKKSGILREIVGNRKEMTIGDNTHNLRIVGNNNRIRISLNVGDITVIGNNTRLKIKTNHGHIKYTGNDGRISLGKDSTERLVDYSGCNGVLKLQNSKNCTQVNDDGDDDDDDEIKNNTTMEKTNINANTNANNSKVKKEQYDLYSSGLPSHSEMFSSHTDYSKMFNRNQSATNRNNKSVLNENSSRQLDQQMPLSIINNFGDIVITNSSNVCISPYSYASQ